MCERIVWQFVCDLCENGVWLCSMQRSFEIGANTVALSLIATGRNKRINLPLYPTKSKTVWILCRFREKVRFSTLPCRFVLPGCPKFLYIGEGVYIYKGEEDTFCGMWMCVCYSALQCGIYSLQPRTDTAIIFYCSLSLSLLFPLPHSRNIRNGARKHRQLGFLNTYYFSANRKLNTSIIKKMYSSRYFVGMPVVVADFFPVRGKKRGLGGWKERSFLCVCVCWRGKEKEEEEEEGNGHYGEFMGAFVRLKINLISAPHFAERRRRRPRRRRKSHDSCIRRRFWQTKICFFNFVLAQKAP